MHFLCILYYQMKFYWVQIRENREKYQRPRQDLDKYGPRWEKTEIEGNWSRPVSRATVHGFCCILDCFPNHQVNTQVTQFSFSKYQICVMFSPTWNQYNVTPKGNKESLSKTNHINTKWIHIGIMGVQKSHMGLPGESCKATLKGFLKDSHHLCILICPKRWTYRKGLGCQPP